MATQYIQRKASLTNLTTLPLTTSASPFRSAIYVDSDTNRLKVIILGFDTVESNVMEVDSTDALTNKTFTAPVINNALVTSAPVAAGSSLTVTAALHAGKTILLNNAAGTAVTLPAATGTGNVYRTVQSVALTSASSTWSKAGADVFAGGILINNTGDTAAATQDFYPTSALNNTITATFSTASSPGGTAIGDWVEFEDIKSGFWAVRGIWQNGVDPVNPFSTV